MFASNKEEREKKEKQRTNGRTKPQLKTNDVTMIRIGVNKIVKTMNIVQLSTWRRREQMND